MHDVQASWFPLVLFSHSMYLFLGLVFSLFFELLIGHWNTFFSKGWSHNCLDSWMLVVLCCISCVFHIFLVWTTIALNKPFLYFFHNLFSLLWQPFYNIIPWLGSLHNSCNHHCQKLPQFVLCILIFLVQRKSNHTPPVQHHKVRKLLLGSTTTNLSVIITLWKQTFKYFTK